MGPRFLWRGNDGAMVIYISNLDCFNGATLFMAWKSKYLSLAKEYVEDASMGPRFLWRGNIVVVCSDKPGGYASMGPRFLWRGNYNARGFRHPASMASMGPRFLWRGNRIRNFFLQFFYLLQWGHAFYGVEILQYEYNSLTMS